MGISQQIGSSSLSKPGVCTSSTRPATPYEGQMIYETNTDKVLVWNGTAWYANWNLPFGIVDTTAGGTSNRGFVAIVAGQSNTAAAGEVDITNATMTFTGIAGRYYQTSLKGVAASTSSAGLATFAVYTGGVKQMLSRVEYSSNGYGDVDMQYVFSVTGSTTVKFTIDSDVATTTIFGTGTSQGQMTIQDIGPV